MISPSERFKFPMLAVDELLTLPKARKDQDMKRIRESANSEDYVTWNVLHLLERTDGWWPALLHLADVKHPVLDNDDVPAIDFWRTVPSPPEYETARRMQMRESKVAKFVERSRNLRSVEGPTEVDAVLEGNGFLIFLEAKLNSDLSPMTTYDPKRNQLARNIDCCIDQARDKLPIVWMLTKDKCPDCLYTQLVDSYREDPSRLHQLLPHRHKKQITGICSRLRIILWSDLMNLIVAHAKSESAILEELQSRIRLQP